MSLTETVSTTEKQQFDFDLKPLLTPLYNVVIGPLTVKFVQRAGFVPINYSTDFAIWWSDPQGIAGDSFANLRVGDTTTIRPFARSYQAVSSQNRLANRDGSPLGIPTVGFALQGDGTIPLGTPISTSPLVTGQGYRYNLVHEQDSDFEDDSLRLSYTITEALVTYGSL